MIKKARIIILILTFIFWTGFFGSFFIKKEIKISQQNKKENNLIKKENKETPLVKKNKKPEEKIKKNYDIFLPKRIRNDYNVNLNEKSAIAIFFDEKGNTKILYQKEIDKKLPIASLTKLMTAMVVVDNYDLDKTTIVSQKAIDTLEEVGRLHVGEKIKIRGLLELALLVSSNDAATALAEVMGEENFVKKMNEKAKEIGLENTYFADPHGLSEKSVSSAKDFAILTEYSILHYPEIWEILGAKQKIIKGYDASGQEIVHIANNTNTLLSEDYVLGGKTGYTEEAGDTMMLAMKAPGSCEGNVVLVLLGLGIAERIPRTKNLYDWVVWAWDWGIR